MTRALETGWVNETVANPLDQVEEFLFETDLQITRTGDKELILTYPGQWALHHLHLLWHSEAFVLHASCGLDMRVMKSDRTKVDEVVSLINQKLWVGHFEVCPDSRCLTYRHTLLLRGQTAACNEQIEDLVSIAVNECDRFFPTFNFVLSKDMSAADALAASMLETMGEA